MSTELLPPEKYMLKVKELIEVLQTLDQDKYVVLSGDSEGNRFSPVPRESFYSTGYLERELNWIGDVYSEQDKEEGYFEPDENTVEVIVLWPVN